MAGCECALTLARAGVACVLYEQKPTIFSPAHASPLLGELVCSNSFRSNDAETSGVGLLKQEMRDLGSAVMAVADAVSVPAGKALAVDRERFAAELTCRIEAEPLIRLVRRPVNSLDPAEEPELAGQWLWRRDLWRPKLWLRPCGSISATRRTPGCIFTTPLLPSSAPNPWTWA